VAEAETRRSNHRLVSASVTYQQSATPMARLIFFGGESTPGGTEVRATHLRLPGAILFRPYRQRREGFSLWKNWGFPKTQDMKKGQIPPRTN
jgi:hypothetical protein